MKRRRLQRVRLRSRGARQERTSLVIRVGRHQLLYWSPGEPFVSLPYSGAIDAMAPTSDGSRLLISSRLQPNGVICELWACPAPTPSSGTVATLYDLREQRVVWRVDGRAIRFDHYAGPVISPDGKYALVSTPSAEDEYRTIALISMKGGAILQTLRSPWNSSYSMGFSRKGRHAWIRGGATIMIYAIHG